MTVRNATIERLRAADEADARPSVQLIAGLRDCLLLCMSLPSTAAKLGISESLVLDYIGPLGTWLTHTEKPSDAETYLVIDVEQPPLFQMVTDTVAVGKGKNRTCKRRVAIPTGYERKAWHKRDVVKAVRSIVISNPSDAALARWIDHAFPVLPKVLKFTHISTVWRFATLGRLDEVDQLNPKSQVYNSLLVSAWDLLDTAVEDAREGIATLVAGGDDLEALAAACAKARWLSEAEISRIERMVITTLAARDAGRPIASLQRSLANELLALSARVRRSPKSYQLDDIAQLNQGQMLRIVQAAGITTGETDRGEEAEFRSKLKELGITQDLDRLVRKGVAATRAGIGEEFWEAMQARVDGDADWSERLNEAFELATA